MIFIIAMIGVVMISMLIFLPTMVGFDVMDIDSLICSCTLPGGKCAICMNLGDRKVSN